jgi:hypothetical protein
MNKKIRQLADRANELADIETQVPGEHLPAWHKVRDRIFVELIVKECAGVAGCNGHVSGFALGDLIKEHFGVEE